MQRPRLRGRLDPGEGRVLVTRTLGATCVEAVRPTASYRAIEFGADAFQVGLVAGSFAALAVVAAIPVGRAADRRGERGLLMFGVALLALAAIIGLSLPWIVGLVLMQAVLGLGQICMSVSCQTLAGNATRSSSDHRFARLSVAVAGGHMIGPLFAGVIIGGGVARLPAVAGTSGALVLVVAIGVLALAFSFGIRSTPSEERQSATSSGGPQPVTELVRIPGMRSAIYAGVAVLTTVDLMVAYLPVIGEARGIPPSIVGYLLATRAAMSILSRLSMGRLLDVLGRRRLLHMALTVSAISVLVIALPAPVWVLFVVLAVAGFLLGLGIPMTTAWAADRAPDGSRGVVLGMRTGGNRFSQMVVPLAVGGVAAGLGPPVVFIVSAAALMAGAALVRRAPIHG